MKNAQLIPSDTNAKVLLLLFQLRIYAVFSFSLLSIIANYYTIPAFMFYLLGIILISNVPLIISLVLFYKKRISFRIWYVFAAVVLLCVVIFVFSGDLAVIARKAIVEACIILLLFRSRYIEDNFIRRHDIKGSKTKAANEAFQDSTSVEL